MNWAAAKAALSDGLSVMREGWDGCRLHLRDGDIVVEYDGRKPTRYRSYKSNERATDWRTIRTGET